MYQKIRLSVLVIRVGCGLRWCLVFMHNIHGTLFACRNSLSLWPVVLSIPLCAILAKESRRWPNRACQARTYERSVAKWLLLLLLSNQLNRHEVVHCNTYSGCNRIEQASWVKITRRLHPRIHLLMQVCNQSKHKQDTLKCEKNITQFQGTIAFSFRTTFCAIPRIIDSGTTG